MPSLLKFVKFAQKPFSQGQPGETISPANSMKDRHECRMGFIGIRQAVNRRIKEKKKKTLPEIHEDNSTVSALSFSFFCKALIVRKYAAADVSAKVLFTSSKCGVAELK